MLAYYYRSVVQYKIAQIDRKLDAIFDINILTQVAVSVYVRPVSVSLLPGNSCLYLSQLHVGSKNESFQNEL